MAPGQLLLTLVRHGTAEAADSGQADFARALTRRGVSEVTEMGRRLAERELAPARLLASPAVRTLQTARLLARALGLSEGLIDTSDALYLAEADTLRAALDDVATEVRHLLVVGHNPGLSEFAQSLGLAEAHGAFEPAATCTIRFAADSWAGCTRSSARSFDYDTPGRVYEPPD